MHTLHTDAKLVGNRCGRVRVQQVPLMHFLRAFQCPSLAWLAFFQSYIRVMRSLVIDKRNIGAKFTARKTTLL
ncbi:hypothetical protein DIJ61_04320 [Burkholderia pseudomallei]|nr:hypothetical protein DIJ61_04320 [Burkholderia pseudomallei]